MMISILLFTTVLAFPKYKQSLLSTKPDSLKKLAYQLSMAKDLQVNVDEDQACNWLKDYKLQTVQDVYYAKMAMSNLEECYIDLDIELPQIEADEFESLYYHSLINGLCPRLDLFTTAGGAAKPNLRKQDDSYKTAAQLYHLALQCEESNVDLSIQEALFNFQEIYEGVTAILDRDNSAALTAQILYSFFSMNITNIHSKLDEYLRNQIYQQTILNFLYTRTNILGSIDEQYWITKLFQLEQVNNIIYPILQDYYVSKTPINVKFVNLKGEKVQPNEFKAFNNNQQLNYVQIKSKEFSGYFEVDSDQSFTLELQFQHYTLKYPIKILQEVQVNEILFDIVHSKTAKPNFHHSVENDEIYPATLNANEKSFLHVIIKMKQQIKGQVAVRLEHPQHSAVTTQVFAEYDTKRKMYYAIIDFGDPDHISPINAIYQVELLLADTHIVPKRWKFLKIDAKFQTQTTFQNDSYYKLPQEIQHQFTQDQPEVPFLFVSFFVAIIIFAFIFFLRMLSSLQLNFDKLPKNESSMLVYLFLGLVIGIFLVLILFWIKLNLIETVTILGILSVPLVIIGNYALLALRKSEKID